MACDCEWRGCAVYLYIHSSTYLYVVWLLSYQWNDPYTVQWNLRIEKWQCDDNGCPHSVISCLTETIISRAIKTQAMVNIPGQLMVTENQIRHNVLWIGHLALYNKNLKHSTLFVEKNSHVYD